MLEFQTANMLNSKIALELRLWIPWLPRQLLLLLLLFFCCCAWAQGPFFSYASAAEIWRTFCVKTFSLFIDNFQALLHILTISHSSPYIFIYFFHILVLSFHISFIYTMKINTLFHQYHLCALSNAYNCNITIFLYNISLVYSHWRQIIRFSTPLQLLLFCYF